VRNGEEIDADYLEPAWGYVVSTMLRNSNCGIGAFMHFASF
jgi:hypothetical protein